MSKERQRRRAAQEAGRSKPGAKPSRPGAAASQARPGARAAAGSGSSATSRKVRGSAGRSGSASRPGARRGGKPTVYRQRRFKPLPTKLKVALAVGWLVIAVLVLVFVPTWTARIGFLVIATMLLPLIVVLVRDPTRRTR